MKKNYTFLTISIIILMIGFSFIGFSQSIATYDIVFTSTWNDAEHGPLPSNPHWSKLVGANHNSNVSFIQVGSLASQGIEFIAESGTNEPFKDQDVQNAINAGYAQQYISGPSLSTAAGTISIDGLEFSNDFPLLSLFTMIADSPDWMMVIDDLELLDGTGNWKTLINIPVLYAYDAGTDSGAFYEADNADVDVPVSVFDESNPIPPFLGNSIGSLTVTLTNVLSVEEVNTLEAIKIFPNPSQGNITISNAISIETIEVYNILGSLVKSINVENTPKIKLDFNKLSPGIYLVKLKDFSGNTKTQKLILE